eukprot:scaffold15004_cov130-Isochrysis_galbana.AAC.3
MRRSGQWRRGMCSRLCEARRSRRSIDTRGGEASGSRRSRPCGRASSRPQQRLSGEARRQVYLGVSASLGVKCTGPCCCSGVGVNTAECQVSTNCLLLGLGREGLGSGVIGSQLRLSGMAA